MSVGACNWSCSVADILPSPASGTPLRTRDRPTAGSVTPSDRRFGAQGAHLAVQRAAVNPEDARRHVAVAIRGGEHLADVLALNPMERPTVEHQVREPAPIAATVLLALVDEKGTAPAVGQTAIEAFIPSAT